MAGTRKQRVVRASALTVLFGAALLYFYVLSYGAFNWHRGQYDRLGVDAPHMLVALYKPVFYYQSIDFPGSRLLYKWGCWCHSYGLGFPMAWDELDSIVAEEYEHARPVFVDEHLESPSLRIR